MKYITNLSPEETAKLISETDATKKGCTGDITKWNYTVRKKIGEDEWSVELTQEQYEATDGLTGEDLLALTMLTREQLDAAVDSINYEEWEVVEL
jgi:hypothetical protein